MLTFPLVSCKNAIKGDEAKKTVNDFFELLGTDDYESMAALMHPDREATEEVLSTYFKDIETEEMIDFSAGITDVKHTGFEAAMHDTKYGGGKYELSGNAKAGQVLFEFEITVVRNDNGYGIYDIEIEE